jgi:uncharacterized protein YhjY with autotransporter beta-barrel domain
MNSIITFTAGLMAGIAYAKNRKEPFKELLASARQMFDKGYESARRHIGKQG